MDGIEMILTTLFFLSLFCLIWCGFSIYCNASYDVDSNNCLHMSLRAEKFFEKIGLDAMVVSDNGVKDRVSKPHAWVVVNFLGYQIHYESTSNSFISSHHRDYTHIWIDTHTWVVV